MKAELAKQDPLAFSIVILKEATANPVSGAVDYGLYMRTVAAQDRDSSKTTGRMAFQGHLILGGYYGAKNLPAPGRMWRGVRGFLAEEGFEAGATAPRMGRTLTGSTEWVVKDAKLAQQELARLQADYTAATNGLKPQVRPRPAGVTRDAGIEIQTGQVFIYDDVPPAFRQGYLAEEFHHYFQLQERGLLGPGKTLTPQVETAIEAEVVGRVKGSGFTPYDSRNYAPYTDVPRPPGVAGN